MSKVGRDDLSPGARSALNKRKPSWAELRREADASDRELRRANGLSWGEALLLSILLVGGLALFSFCLILLGVLLGRMR